MNTQEKRAIKEVLFDYNAETIEFAGDIADRILRKLDELRKPSEPETNVCEAGEEFISAIIDILERNQSPEINFIGEATGRLAVYSDTYLDIATEIAALMQPDSELL